MTRTKIRDNSEIIRIKYKYQKLIIERKIRVPFAIAKKLLGPDLAYHLYWCYKKTEDISQD